MTTFTPTSSSFILLSFGGIEGHNAIDFHLLLSRKLREQGKGKLPLLFVVFPSSIADKEPPSQNPRSKARSFARGGKRRLPPFSATQLFSCDEYRSYGRMRREKRGDGLMMMYIQMKKRKP